MVCIPQSNFIPEPTRPVWFDKELASFDADLSVVWHARERAYSGEYAHYRVTRRLPERELGWAMQNGLFLPERGRPQDETVLDWIDEEGHGKPLDRRLFDTLAACDPARWDSDRFTGFKKMCAARDEKRQREQDDEKRASAAETADAVMRAVYTNPKSRRKRTDHVESTAV